MRRRVLDVSRLSSNHNPMSRSGDLDTTSPSRVLAENVRQLRTARGLTQAQMAKRAGLPRATWANVESGDANPTLAVVHAVGFALDVSIEELLRPTVAACVLYPRESIPTQKRGSVGIRHLLPEPLVGATIDRFDMPPRARMKGMPHTPGTREYLTVERGTISLVTTGEQFVLREGDVLAFRGDQKHSYVNGSATEAAIGYSVVVLVDPSAPK